MFAVFLKNYQFDLGSPHTNILIKVSSKIINENSRISRNQYRFFFNFIDSTFVLYKYVFRILLSHHQYELTNRGHTYKYRMFIVANYPPGCTFVRVIMIR